MTTLAKIHARGAGCLAAEQIYRNKLGAMPAAELFTLADFGKKSNVKQGVLDRAINIGWLQVIGGAISLTANAIAYFDDLESPQPAYIGQIATSRASSAYDRPPLSRRFIPNVRGTRDDVPEFSVREHQHFHTQA